MKRVYDINRTEYSHLILPSRPAVEKKSSIGDVKIDPDNQLSQEWKQEFINICQDFSDILTPVPGKCNGYFGFIDNSLNFTKTPPTSIKA